MRQMTIRQLRRSKELTQQQLAEKLGIAVVTYQTYEKCPAQMRIKTLLKLCDVLEVDVRAIKLFNGSSDMFIEQD